MSISHSVSQGVGQFNHLYQSFNLLISKPFIQSILYFQIDLMKPLWIAGIVTQGGTEVVQDGSNQIVEFSVEYGLDISHLLFYEETFSKKKVINYKLR